MHCPKCGHPKQPNGSECLKCGIIFEKYKVILNQNKAENKLLPIYEKSKHTAKKRLIISAFLSITILSVIGLMIFPYTQHEKQSSVMSRGNPERTGVYASSGPKTLTDPVWKFKTEGMVASPAILDGILYFESGDDYLCAVDINTGQEKWKFKAGGRVISPALSDGMAYFGSGSCFEGDSYFYAIDMKTGQEKWKFKAGGDVFYPAVSDGIVYFGSCDAYLYALDTKTGQEKWKFKTEGRAGEPAISDGMAYFQSMGGYLYAVDINTGQEKWKRNTEREGGVFGNPAVSGGIVYFGGSDFYLYAVDMKTGEEKWKFKAEDMVSDPAISGEMVYFGSWDNYLYAVDTNTGHEKWKFKTEGWVVCAPAIAGEMLYFGSADQCLYAVDINTGQEKWKFKTGGLIMHPAVLDGVLYFGGGSYLYAVKENGVKIEEQTREQISSNNMFDILFYGLELQTKKIDGQFPQLSISNAGDIYPFLNIFPIPSNQIHDFLTNDERVRCIQAEFGKFFIVFRFGNEPNQWNGKLYEMHFNIEYPNKEIAEDETRVYKKLNLLYGDYARIEKFRRSAEDIDEDLNLYIWQFNNIVITYRSIYTQERSTIVVVEYWDNKFYTTNNYYEY